MGTWPRPTARTLAFLAAGAALIVLGWAFGEPDAVGPALLLVFFPLTSLVISSMTWPRLRVERTPRPPVTQVGDPLEVDLCVTAERGGGPDRIVGEEDPGRLFRGGPHRMLLDAARAGDRTLGSYAITARRRGRHTLDGFRAHATGLLGFWTRTLRVASATPVIVTPRVHRLEPIAARQYGQTGETPIPQPAVFGPDDAMVREYQPRDDVRRIHWPSTARTGALMVRREEAAFDLTAWVILDSRAEVHPSARGERATFEWLVSVAASIGARLLDDGYLVTLADAEGVTQRVAPGDPVAAADWLGPLIDLDVSGETDLHHPARALAEAGTQHLVLALLGRLDRNVADQLVSSRATRQERHALVVVPEGEDERADFEEGRRALGEHGWSVWETAVNGDLAGLWSDLVLPGREAGR